MAEGAEGFSLALVDAVVAGLPTVATDISGNRDIIRDAVSGYLTPPDNFNQLGDRVIELRDNRKKRAMGTEARKVVKKHAWSEIARQYVEVYLEARKHCR